MKFYLLVFADFLSTLKYYLSNSHTQLCSVFFQGTLHDLVFRSDARPGQTESQLDKVFNLRILACDSVWPELRVRFKPLFWYKLFFH